MQLYKYQFPAIGWLPEESMDNVIKSLEGHLNDGPECLMAYCMFPTDSAILDHVGIETDGNGNLNTINMYTYTELWDGNEDDLRSCLDENLHNALEECFGEHTVDIGIGETIPMGREGGIPETLYYISTEKNYQNILKQGIIPSIGTNNYKNTENRVYLTEKHDLAPWLAILKHKNNPVILEVNTEGLNLETGRAFRDRDFVPGKTYGEYFSKETIPASALKQIDLEHSSTEFGGALCGAMFEQVELATTKDEIAEVRTGLERLASMGLMKEEQVEAVMENRINLLKQQEPENIAKEYSEDTEGLPWDTEDAGRDLIRALDGMSYVEPIISK